MSPEELRRLATELHSVATSEGPPLQSELAGRLDALRALYRRDRGSFPADVLSLLRDVASAVAAARPKPQSVLEHVFGYPSFRPGQAEIIETVLAGRDCVGIMPTGAGKSLTFQIPARVMGGVTLVVSPLIALMKDQVDALTEVGLRATFLNSSVPADERAARVRAVAAGHFEVVYAAPEGLSASAGRALTGARLSLIAVDEAHCISQWGHDFRPAYRELRELKRRFGGVPILALTATATAAVTRDIVEQLAMRDPGMFRGSFFRPNLRVAVLKKGGAGAEGRRLPAVGEAIVRLVQERRGESGIVYCLSRKSTETTAEMLRDAGISALAYHAGMEAERRTKVQDAFQKDDVDVVVATIAFGMGIDKSNVRFVIHRDMPRSIEGYYQEIGRAGRDGVASDCVLFYSWADVLTYDRFATDAPAEVAARQSEMARQMYRLAESSTCRHQDIVGYFGEHVPPCGSSCDQCGGIDVLGAFDRRRPRARARAVEAPKSDQQALLDALKVLRKELARERSVPAYQVFSDATLLEMIARRPESEAQLLAVPGVGPKKLAAYGGEFLSTLRCFR